MGFKIIEIRAGKNIGISQEGKPVDPTQPLWSLNQLLRHQDKPYVRTIAGTNQPSAFSINADTPAKLKVTVRYDDEMSFCRGTLDAYYNERKLFSSQNVEWNSDERVALFDVYANGHPERFCRFSGELTWKINWPNDNGNIGCSEVGKTYLELFWLHGFGNNLFPKGIPVEILRQAAYALKITGRSATNIILAGSKTNGTIKPSSDPVIEAIVDVVFFRNPPAYNIYDDDDYFLIGTMPGKPMAFLLNQYLSSIHDPTSLCNCFDMTAAVQIFLKAVGIKNVKFCRMKPFGYISLTKLVGRGLSNNPFHSQEVRSIRESELIVDEFNKLRTTFSSHTFCCLPDECFPSRNNTIGSTKCVGRNYCQHHCSNCRILDACIGPHVGNEDIDKYMKNAVANESPDGCCEKKDFLVSRGITHIDWLPKPETETTSSRNIALKKIIGCSGEKFPCDEFFVVCPWPDPRNCHVLDKGWDIYFKEVVPGACRAMKTWKLQNKGASIQINIQVTSPSEELTAFQAAHYSFLEFISESILERSPHEKGPSYLEQYCATFSRKSFCYDYWTKYNVVFRVTCRNISCDFGALKVWFNELAYKYRKSSIGEDLPSLAEIKKRIIIKIGEKAVLETNSPKNVFIDFVFKEGDNLGIQLVKQRDKRLEFIGLRKSTNIATVAFVDKDTLLTNSRDITIEVEE